MRPSLTKVVNEPADEEWMPERELPLYAIPLSEMDV